MTKISWFSRLPNEDTAAATANCAAESIGLAILVLVTVMAQGQTATPDLKPVVQDGYTIHHTADLGGHIAGITGSGAMYDTLVNIHSGPRVLGETFTLHALPITKHTLFDDLSAISSGFGGDPNNFAKMDISKGKLYEFSGIFRRDRQYFDYDLLGNPLIPSRLSMPIGPANAPTGALLWPQVEQSPVMFNTVRRLTDVNLTILPLSKVTFRVAYSQNIFQGPSLSPGESVGKYDSLLEEYQRNSTDDFIGGIDWKPFPRTRFTFEEQVTHYKAGSYFTLAPSDFLVQEADGTPVSLGDWDSTVPIGIGGCNTGSMGSGYTSPTVYTILTAPVTPGGRPVINPACDAITSYLRSQPTRVLTPTEILRFQSSSISNVAMNGDFHYTNANSNLPNYYENFNGLDGAVRTATFTGSATAERQVLGTDFGITWQATKAFALSEQVDFSNVHQPGTSIINEANGNTPTTVVVGNNGHETINYAGALTPITNGITAEGSSGGSALPGYFGQKFLTNNVTATWDASTSATLSLTYRHRTHDIIQGAATGTASSLVTINENGGIFNAALRPSLRWDVNGTVEVLYDDNALTPVGPRQTKHYRVHTLYRPKPWATISGAYNDLERHNNTNNTGATPIDGPLDHVDHSRVGSLGLVLAPTEHYGFDFNYSYSDVYTSTNICYLNGATAALPGAASSKSSGAANICPGVFARGSTTVLSDWGPAKDFMDAPTQYASVGVTYSPNAVLRSAAGYRISAVSGNQFFNDAQAVNASLQSAYQSPYVNIAFTLHPGLVWRAEYNYYGYGEGGPSGAPFCSSSTGLTATVVPCNSSLLTGPTGLTESPSGLSAPRNFHANNVTLAIHYEF